ncbi:FAD/NAD(P)-binding protein [Mastigocoleus sp. MO_188.B34]|uniref:NAD(P)-binding protein n=1 Tax=Mastigocoleus sp. MO_188.B34 TaxID=3036635 RepID=UPI002619122D|nr:FAD/NAD(P)-binding protein [Mastigocoleus sp. MO_188.B34]MDJ0697243.1 NAD(P)/FAD-dependent oxidoreductase [Mastigocoleus sp. MO_188.B34]
MKKQKNSSNAKPSSASPLHPIRLEYTIKGNEKSIIEKGCELLVIACDPRNLYTICDYTAEERAIFDKLRNFTFHTSLLKVKVNSSSPKTKTYSVIFAPKPLQDMNGSVYAYRNESAKQFGPEHASTMTHNLVTVYQLEGEAETPLSTSKFKEILEQQLKDSDWWPFSTDYEVLKTFTTPYFNHFSNEDLKKGLTWEILNLQGQNNTLYVHGFTCFESVLHCWDYAALMLDFVGSAKQPLPTKLEAPIVILGAGVSGLLFAIRLKRLGYTNIEILESTDRYSGKTYTLIEDEPYPSESKEKTICELGTCYLSPAYYHLLEDLKEFFVDNNQIDFAKNDPNFRGVVTQGEFPDSFDVAPIITQQDYILLKAKALLGLPQNSDSQSIMLQIALDLARYSILHWEIMGSQTPMPPKPPTVLLEKTFYQFLEDNKLLSLVGMMEYIYSVQGYGVMRSIPAYYGLIWITPIVIQTILLDNMSPKNIPVVTALKKGWGDVWDQIVTKGNLRITYLVETKSITRHC